MLAQSQLFPEQHFPHRLSIQHTSRHCFEFCRWQERQQSIGHPRLSGDLRVQTLGLKLLQQNVPRSDCFKTVASKTPHDIEAEIVLVQRRDDHEASVSSVLFRQFLTKL